jgi:hypothetical protein
MPRTKKVRNMGEEGCIPTSAHGRDIKKEAEEYHGWAVRRRPPILLPMEQQRGGGL